MPHRPFDDFRALCHQFPAPDSGSIVIATKWQEQANKPQDGLGRLEDIAIWYAGWQGTYKPVIKKPILAIFVSTHGIGLEEITGIAPEQMLKTINNFSAGRGAINQICFANNLGLKLFDLALDYPTMDIRHGAAMEERAAAATMAFGMESIIGDIDLLAIGQMSAHSFISAAAICTTLFGGAPEDWLPSFPHTNCSLQKRQVTAIEQALALHAGHLTDPFEIMRRLGGREIAGIMGALLAARMQKIPVILDGFVTTAAAALLFKCNPDALSHCLAGHASGHRGHKRLLEFLNKKPILDLNIAMEDGVGAALASTIVRSAVLTHSEMARRCDNKQKSCTS